MRISGFQIELKEVARVCRRFDFAVFEAVMGLRGKRPEEKLSSIPGLAQFNTTGVALCLWLSICLNRTSLRSCWTLQTCPFIVTFTWPTKLNGSGCLQLWQTYKGISSTCNTWNTLCSQPEHVVKTLSFRPRLESFFSSWTIPVCWRTTLSITKSAKRSRTFQTFCQTFCSLHRTEHFKKSSKVSSSVSPQTSKTLGRSRPWRSCCTHCWTWELNWKSSAQPGRQFKTHGTDWDGLCQWLCISVH